MPRKPKVFPEEVGASEDEFSFSPEEIEITPEEVSATPENDSFNPQSEVIKAVPEERQKRLDFLVRRTRSQAIKYVRKWLSYACDEEEIEYIINQIFKS